MNLLIQRQTDFNLSSRNAWDVFADHRDRVTSQLMQGVDGSRLCILGAGNCNDLDLQTLVQFHREVHLVDIDTNALDQGVVRQNLANHSRIHVHGDIDLTGMLDQIANWSSDTHVSETDIAAFLDHPIHSLKRIPGPFDVVASTCILSQLIKTVVDAVGEEHQRFLALIQAIRMGHLRHLMQLTVSGGTSLLFTDVVSSTSYPGLASVPTHNLSQVLSQLIKDGNFFHGVNPAVLMNLFRQDPELSEQVTTIEPIGPWLWDLGPRSYAVVALKLKRR
ncbi:hypothetical protein C1752_06408 [Acaryochloris thomasi RCC1774]|uniref:Methyltransferase domain-containing protein n=1 Tax=Acaryochloris thomasi RCC1774 TaxID=1764569 RepID=A0A2W1JIV1_9CYAN|nr:hypothetical protein [Acaryochloris thomasi]PZD71445.1 hypothetical protein C1752_06408 [Acaryochloris thomasi RCC1774]